MSKRREKLKKRKRGFEKCHTAEGRREKRIGAVTNEKRAKRGSTLERVESMKKQGERDRRSGY